MSDSDDDIAGLLPGTSAGAQPRGAAPGQQRMANLRAMLDETTSDDEGGPQIGGARTAPATASAGAPKKRALPLIGSHGRQPTQQQPASPTPRPDNGRRVAPASPPSSPASTTGGSVEYREEDAVAAAASSIDGDNDGLDDVSFNLNTASPSQARTDATTANAGTPAPTAPPPSIQQVQVQPERRGQTDGAAYRGDIDSSSIAPVKQTIKKFSPAPDAGSPPPPPRQQQKQPPVSNAVRHPDDELEGDDDEFELDGLEAILPRATAAQQQQQQQAHSRRVPSGASTPPQRAAAPPQQLAQPPRLQTPASASAAAVVPRGADGLEALLARAQQRLRQRESEDELRRSLGCSGGNSSGSAAPASRGTSPAPLHGDSGGGAYRRTASGLDGARTTLASHQAGGSLLAGPNSDEFAAVRLQRENARLCDELALLTQENQQLKAHAGARTNAAAVSKLELEVEVLKDLEVRARAATAHTETQLEEARDHARQLQDELRAALQTADKYEAMLREMEARIAQEQAEATALRAEAHERRQELARAKSEAELLRADDAVRIERLTGLLEDAKKQRAHLTELNDKLARDKEAAVAERRRTADAHKALQVDCAREKEQHADALAQLRRDVERQRVLGQEKERALHAQIADERRGREVFEGKLHDAEVQATAAATQHQEAMRALRDDHRAQLEALREQLAAAKAAAAAAEERADRRAGEQTEAALRTAQNEAQRLTQHLRAAESARDEAATIAAQLDEDCRQLASERDALRADLQRALAAAEEWQRGKEAVDTQCTKLSSTLNLMLLSDDKLQQDNATLRSDLAAAHADLESIRLEVETCVRMEQQLQQLAAENERLSDECARHARERAELVKENGTMAEEMTRWRQEVRELINKRSGNGGGSGNGQRVGAIRIADGF